MNANRTIRSLVFAAGLVLLTACTAPRQPKAETEALGPDGYVPAPAAALAFAPRISPPEIMPDLSRDIRQPSVFAGYDSQSTSFIYTRTDDRQTSRWDDRYERRSIITHIQMSTR